VIFFVLTDEAYEHIVYPPHRRVYLSTLKGMRFCRRGLLRSVYCHAFENSNFSSLDRHWYIPSYNIYLGRSGKGHSSLDKNPDSAVRLSRSHGIHRIIACKIRNQGFHVTAGCRANGASFRRSCAG
jgi:hypothetical protein